MAKGGGNSGGGGGVSGGGGKGGKHGQRVVSQKSLHPAVIEIHIKPKKIVRR